MTTKSTPPNNNNVIDHPELITMRSRTAPNSSQSSTDFSSASFRHPAIPEEPNTLSDLYDVVPEVLPPEEITDIVKNRRPQTTLRPLPPRSSTYVRSRSNSLPVVHGNFVFINREANRPYSECHDDLNKKVRFDRNNPRNFFFIIYMSWRLVA